MANEKLCRKYNLNPNVIKNILHSLRTGLLREVRKEQGGQQSKWKFFEALSYTKEDVLRGIKAKEQKEWSDDKIEKLIEFYKVNEQ